MPDEHGDCVRVARAAVSARCPDRPPWLTVMATLSLITALLWLMMAFLIAVLLVLMRAVENAAAGLRVGMFADAALRRQLFWLGALDLASGVWLLVAAVAAYGCRAVTRPLHNGLAWVRIVLLVVWLAVMVATGGSIVMPAGGAGSSPLFLAVAGGLELIYPIAILVVFNKPAHRRQLAAMSTPRSPRPNGS